MTYTAPDPVAYALQRGNTDEKLTGELAKIDNEFDAHATQLNTHTGALALCEKIAVANLTAGNANAFCLAMANPETVGIIINKLIIKVTTPGGTVGGLGDFGTAANGTTHSDNLIDGADINAAAVYDNLTDKGANGKTTQILAAGQFITGQILVSNAAALVGKAYLIYAIPY